MNKIANNASLPSGTSLLGYQLWRAVGQTASSIIYDATHTILGVDVQVHEFYAAEHMRRDAATGTWTILPGHEAATMQELTQFVDNMRLISALRAGGVLPIRHAFAMEDLSIYCCVVPKLQRCVAPASAADLSQLLLQGIETIYHLASLGYSPLCLSSENMGRGGDGALYINLLANIMPVGQLPATTVAGYAPIEYVSPGSAAAGIFSSLYSFAAVVYETLFGQAMPASEARIAKIDPYKPLASQPQLVKKYTQPLLASIDKALALWPDDRWHDATDWVKAIHEALIPAKRGRRPAPPFFDTEPQKDYSTDIVQAISAGNVDALLYEGALIDAAIAAGGTTPLHYAVNCGSHTCVQALLNHGANLEVYDTEGNTPLYLASLQGQLDCVKLLLKAGASPNLPHRQSGKTPLMAAVEGGHMPCVEYLMGAGADASLESKSGKKARDYTKSYKNKLKLIWLDNFATPVTAAAASGADALAMVLKEGAYPDNLDCVSDMSPLMKWAASSHPDKAEAIRLLLAAGADAQLENKAGKTAMDFATDDNTRSLLEASDVTPITLLGAVRVDNLSALRSMLADGASPDEPRTSRGGTPLLHALALGHAQCARLLIEYGASIRMPTRLGTTPLAAAAAGDLPECILLLLELGLDVNARNKKGVTPLMVAASEDNTECIKVLLEKGAQLEARDADGRSALMWAASEGAAEAISTLIEAGAEIEAEDNEGSTAFMLAAAGDSVEAVERLADSMADIEAKDSDGNTPLHVAASDGSPDVLKYILHECHADIEAQNNSGNMALHLAAASGCTPSVRVLLLAGASVNARTKEGLTPLMAACTEESDAEALRVLLASRAIPNEQDNSGRTALMYCAINNTADCAYALIAAGAQVNACDKDGNTALMYAALHSHEAVLAALLSAGADKKLKNKAGYTAGTLAKNQTCRNLLA